MYRKIFITLFAMVIAFGALAQPKRAVLDKVVAVVGNSSILYSEVQATANDLVQRRLSEGYTSDRDPMNEALETLLEQRLLANQAMLDSVEFDESMVNDMAEQQLSGLITEAGSIPQFERQNNMELFNVRENLRGKYREQAQAQAMRTEIMSRVKVVPSEVEDYYKSLKKSDLPTIGEQYTYAQITRFPTSIEEAKTRVKERLLEMRQRIVTGETKFAVLAQLYSMDPGSAYRGGAMDPSPSKGYVSAFAETLESLRVGQVSEMVETEFGFHIIELLDKKGEMYTCRHILLKPTFTSDELIEPVQFLDSLTRQINDGKIEFEEAVREYSQDNTSKMNGGIVSNQDILARFNTFDATLTVTKFYKEDFGSRGYKSLDDYTALSKLKVGEISPAFITEDMMGNNLAKVVKLVEITPAHKISMEDDYLKIENLALESKRVKVIEEWLSKHIESMYVYIAPEMRDGEFKNKKWLK